MKIQKEDIETFIFVHDQEIILKFEELGKFSGFDDYKYVFLGNRDRSKLTSVNNIMFAYDYEINLENYPKMCSYSGWFLLYKNNLISKKYVNLFEYDVILADDFINKQVEFIDDNYDYYNYTPLSTRIEFVNPRWISELIKFYNKKKINILESLRVNLISKNIDVWPTTSNVTMKSSFFNSYMSKNEEIFDFLKSTEMVGHALERLLGIQTIISKDINMKYIDNMLRHYQLDSHKTQGHNVMDNETALNILGGSKL